MLDASARSASDSKTVCNETGRAETLARRGELVALEVRDIELWPNGTGQALIRRGKTDVEGQGRGAYLSRETVKWLNIWVEHAKITEGAIFRRLIGRDEIGDALHAGSIAPIFKRVAQWIGMPARFVAEVSGHSTRVIAGRRVSRTATCTRLPRPTTPRKAAWSRCTRGGIRSCILITPDSTPSWTQSPAAASGLRPVLARAHDQAIPAHPFRYFEPRALYENFCPCTAAWYISPPFAIVNTATPWR